MQSTISDIGYGYGYLLASEIAENYQSLLKNLLGDKWYDEVSELTVYWVTTIEYLATHFHG